MIVAALGFAAAENILILFSNIPAGLADSELFVQITMTSSFRALTAILLHTLCSGILGFFMANAYCRRHGKTLFIAAGFLIVSGLHGLYNLSILQSKGITEFLAIALPLLGILSLGLYAGFKKAKEMKSVCSLKI